MDGKAQKKPGPVAGPEMVRTNVLIEPELLEWGKAQPGGLSNIVRRSLYQKKASVWVCQVCGKPIDDHKGFIEVVNTNPDIGTVNGYPRRPTEEPEIERDSFGSYSAKALMDAYEDHKPNIGFIVFHVACDPHPDTEGYVINLGRAKSLSDWVGWVLHLFGKAWMGHEDLENMLAFWWTHRGERPPDP